MYEKVISVLAKIIRSPVDRRRNVTINDRENSEKYELLRKNAHSRISLGFFFSLRADLSHKSIATRAFFVINKRRRLSVENAEEDSTRLLSLSLIYLFFALLSSTAVIFRDMRVSILVASHEYC